ncbi:MAG: site-specific DNA-methyltransferase [Actinobacteria bacterium]|nr:site-specific DNA-methyltransferase [Actinomycetota bacterium]
MQIPLRLVRADARELLAALPAASVDLILTDPPYHFDRGHTYFRQWFPELPDEAWPEIFAGLFRVLRADRHAYVFSDTRTRPVFEAAAKAAGFEVKTPIVWDKISVGLGAGTWRPRYELILFFTKGSRPGNRRDRGNVLAAKRVFRGYPTEKPVPLLRELIDQSSRRGEVVFDPFCGSGSTGVAARMLERRTLLGDLDPSTAALRLGIAAEALPKRRGEEAA